MPYHRLDVYQKSYTLALELHRVSMKYPKHEQYEMGQQLRRSSKSIPANIAEGMGKQESPRDVIHYMRIAMGSCDESRVWLEFSRDLGYISEREQSEFDSRFQEIGRMLHGIIKRYSSKNKKR